MLATAATLDTEAPEEESLIFIVFLLCLIVVFLLVLLAIAISNLFLLRSLKDFQHPDIKPLVSILVPARNEEEVIGRCVKSLLDQDYPNFEILVLDDDSTDSTWQILEKLAASDHRLKIARGTLMPPGWLGKHCACHQLSLKAEGKFLLFTDADTIHRPSMIRHAVAAQEHEGADMISALPQQVMPSFMEKLVMPFSYWTIMCFLPLVIAYRNQNTLFSAATGQFMLFRRSAYDSIGGFTSVKHHVVDDVQLCRKIRAQGLRWRLFDGSGFYSVRQYKSFKELFEGHTKNLFAGFNNNLPAFIMIWLWLLLVFWMPLVILMAGSTVFSTLSLPLYLSCASVAVSLAIWAIAYVRFHFPIYMVLFYPFSALMMSFMAAGSMVLNYRKKATWKGRTMPGGV
jgi:chlorobactene glucosyltransferase